MQLDRRTDSTCKKVLTFVALTLVASRCVSQFLFKCHYHHQVPIFRLSRPLVVLCCVAGHQRSVTVVQTAFSSQFLLLFMLFLVLIIHFLVFSSFSLSSSATPLLLLQQVRRKRRYSVRCSFRRIRSVRVWWVTATASTANTHSRPNTATRAASTWPLNRASP